MTAPARPILPLADPSCQQPIWETVAGCTFHNADPQKPHTQAYTDAAYPISCCTPNTPMHTLYAKAHWSPLGSLLQSAMADCIHNMHQRNHSCPVEPKPPPHTSFNWQATPHMSCSDNLWAGSTFFSIWKYIGRLSTIFRHFPFFLLGSTEKTAPDLTLPTMLYPILTFEVLSWPLVKVLTISRRSLLPHGVSARNRLTNMKKQFVFISFKHWTVLNLQYNQW